jgi:hypothetical protein
MGLWDGGIDAGFIGAYAFRPKWHKRITIRHKTFITSLLR